MKNIDFEKHNELLKKIGYGIISMNSEVQTIYYLMKYKENGNVILRKLGKYFPSLNMKVIKSSDTLNGLTKEVHEVLKENEEILNTTICGNFICSKIVFDTKGN